MDVVSVEDVAGIFPRELTDDEITRVGNLIDVALELVDEEFLRRRRDFYSEVEDSRLLQLTVKRVVREMVSEAVHVGQDVGRASVSSTTGPQSDSVTWSQGVGIHWGGVFMSARWLSDLGLVKGGSLYRFPPAKTYGDSPHVYGVEFAERWRR